VALGKCRRTTDIRVEQAGRGARSSAGDPEATTGDAEALDADGVADVDADGTAVAVPARAQPA
jgi:hypothetical protein